MLGADAQRTAAIGAIGHRLHVATFHFACLSMRGQDSTSLLAATLIFVCFMAFSLQHGSSFMLSRSSCIISSSRISTHLSSYSYPFVMSNHNHKRCADSSPNTDPNHDARPFHNAMKRLHRSSPTQLQQSTTEQVDDDYEKEVVTETTIPTLYRAEGLLAVYKPLHWTSQDVVAYIRGILTRDAKDRGIVVPKSKKSNGRIKVGHGGTLDPLAEGVLVIGIGTGTKSLDSFLSGSKMYQASAKLGFQTTTLDMEGQVTHEEPYHHVTMESIQAILNQFQGKIQQIPPVFSAIRKNGKKLYEEAREGKTAEDLSIEPREVEIINLTCRPQNHMGESLPCFGLDVECGGGTYIRSLVRDMGLTLKTRATMTHLVRTRQGPFTIQDALKKEEWTPERIAEMIRSV